MSPHWSLGVIIGLPVAALVALIALAIIGWGVSVRSHDSDGGFAVGVGAVILAVVLVAVGFFMWPWDARFHQWRPVAGAVQQKSSRIIPDGKTVNQRIVLVIAGKPYGCDDTRCALLEAGDRVALTCKPEYQYAGVSGEACEFIGSTRTGDMP